MKNSALDMTRPNASSLLDSPDSLSLLSLWRILWGRKWTIFFVSFLFALAGFVIASLGERSYTAESLLVLEDNNAALTNALSRDGVVYDDPSQAVQVFGSRQVIGRVVDDLNLVNDAEFNPFLDNEADEAPSLLQTLISSVVALLPITADQTDEEEPTVTLSDTFIRQTVVRSVQERVRFISDPRTTIIRVVATTENPERSAELANAVAEAFLRDLLETRLESVDQIAERLGRRVGELRQDVRDREIALQEFQNSTDAKDRNSLSVLSDEAQVLRARLELFDQRQVQQEALLSRLDEIETLPQQEQISRIAQDDALMALWGSGAAGAANVSELRQIIQDRAERDQQFTTSLRESLDRLNEQITEASEQQLRYQQLEREVAAATEIYDFSVRRLNEVLVQSGVESGGGRIVFGAEVPQVPNGRGRVRTAFLMGLLGFVTIIAWVLIRAATNQNIRTVVDLQHILPGRRIVAVPRAPRGRFFDGRARKKRLLLTAETTEYTESVRRLRSALTSGESSRDATLILMTSDFATASKSLLTLGLARSYALLGKKVLLVGADMRRMTLGRQIGRTVSQVSLQDVLSDLQKLDGDTIRNADMGIQMLLPERQSESPADILESQNFKAFIDLVRSDYDVVLIDAPPLLIAPDAALVSKHADRLVFITTANASTPDTVFAALEQLPDGLGENDVVALYAAQSSQDAQVDLRNRKFAQI